MLPLVHVEAVAAVDDDACSHPIGKQVGVEVDELFPLGEHQHRVGAVAGFLHRDRVIQCGKQPLGVLQGFGVVDVDCRPVEL